MATKEQQDFQAKQIARDTRYAEVVKDQEIDSLRADNARLEAGLRAAVSAAQVREAQQQIAISLLQAGNERLVEALQGLMLYYVGERGSHNILGEAGVAADRARAILRDLGEL